MIEQEKSFHAISFLRAGATQLRQFASNEGPISTELRRIAREWDERADGLEAAGGNQKEVPIAA